MAARRPCSFCCSGSLQMPMRTPTLRWPASLSRRDTSCRARARASSRVSAWGTRRSPSRLSWMLIAIAQEQRRAQALFQLLDARTDGGLGDAEVLRRLAKMAGPADLEKCSKQFCIHTTASGPAPPQLSAWVA